MCRFVVVNSLNIPKRSLLQDSRDAEREEAMEDVVEEIEQKRWKRSLTTTKRSRSSSKSSSCLINNLDDGCLMHIFSFLSPIPGAYLFSLILFLYFSKRLKLLCKNPIFNSTYESLHHASLWVLVQLHFH